MKDLTDEYFKIRKPEIETPIIPHNQFLFFMVATGLIGLLLFVCYFYYPLFVNGNYKNPFVAGTFIIMTVAFMTEPMMETQLGMSILFFFLTIELIGGNSLNAQEV